MELERQVCRVRARWHMARIQKNGMHGNPQQGGFSKNGVPLAFLFLFEECHGVGIRAATRAFHGMEVVREE